MKTITFDALLVQLIKRSGRDTNPTAADYPGEAVMLSLRLQEVFEYPTAGWGFTQVLESVDVPDQIYLQDFGLDEVNDFYTKDAALINTKAAFTLSGDQTVEWDGSQWVVYDTTNAAAYTSPEDVATPDLVQTWAATGRGVAPLGTVVQSRYETIDISDGKRVTGVYADDPRQDYAVVLLEYNVVVGGELRVQSTGLNKLWYTYIPETPDYQNDDPAPTIYDVWRRAVIELAYADMLRKETNPDHEGAGRAEAKGYRLLDDLCLRFAGNNTRPRLHVRTAVPRQGHARYYGVNT